MIRELLEKIEASVNIRENTVATSLTTEIDWNLGNVQEVLLSEPNYLMQFIPPTKGGQLLKLLIKQNNVGNNNINFDTIIFNHDIRPIFNKAPNSVTVINLYYDSQNFYCIDHIEIGKQKKKSMYSISADTHDGMAPTRIGSGTFALIGSLTDENNVVHNGLIRLSSTNSANSGVLYSTTSNAYSHLVQGGDIFTCDFSVRSINANMRLGFITTANQNDCTNGVYAEIGANLQIIGKTANNSIRSQTTPNTIVLNTWYKLVIFISYDNSTAYFSLFNSLGVKVWGNNLSTNLPKLSTNVGVIALARNAAPSTILAALEFISFGNQVK